MLGGRWSNEAIRGKLVWLQREREGQVVQARLEVDRRQITTACGTTTEER